MLRNRDNMSTIQIQANATTELLNVLNWELLQDLGPRLSCTECEALAMWLEAYGEVEDAGILRKSHAMEDDEGDQHWDLRKQIEKEEKE